MPPRYSCARPPLVFVITGRDAVIHDFLRVGKRVDGRIKSGHDDLVDIHGNRPALAAVGFDTAAGSFGLASDTTIPGVSRY